MPLPVTVTAALSPPNAASLGLLIRTAPQIIATAITKAVGQLIIGASINVEDAQSSPGRHGLPITHYPSLHGA